MQLSPHFDLALLCASETATERGIANTPDHPEIIENLRALAMNVLEPFETRLNLPICVTSGYRCAALNEAVGGRPDSQHVTGEAVDFLVGGLRCDQACNWIIETLDFDELILEKFDPRQGEFGWIHCSFSRTSNRGLVSTFDGVAYHHGLVAVGIVPAARSAKTLDRPPPFALL